ncbi:predicted protein [Naegleria gruberi]|uniref:UTP--glucose-1-phosphate uridylyltransferase n=1 Tax=Naegleria gruberi TaxID=5762 RepID=D2W5B1_NAEGR|nr:uncharacterized protein NAEGRDRAFT_54772 [Naegleria gruberi]EFC35740.1 predicted protein [Naegleria gruberi]|eukprot:XP_002668484.1 predicted protein [Naegleria gruberi strain NEG-M]
MAITKVIIPIAGHGTRMFPASKVMPKALFPILDPKDKLCKPILLIIIEHAVEALLAEQPQIGWDDIQVCIVMQENQRSIIEEFFNAPCAFSMEGKAKEIQDSMRMIEKISKTLTFIVQEEQLGFGHALLCCADKFIKENEAFIVLLGDHIYTSRTQSGKSCLQYAVRAFNKFNKAIVTLDTISEKHTYANGVLKIGQVLEKESEVVYTSILTTIEKPNKIQCENHNLYITEEELQMLEVERTCKNENDVVCYFGIDILTYEVFTHLRENWKCGKLHNGELNLREAMCPTIERGDMVGVFVRDASRHDTGLPFEYWQSLQDFYNNIKNK